MLLLRDGSVTFVFFVAPPTEYIGYCFACHLSLFYFVYVFFKRKFETLNSLFLTARPTHQKENNKLPGRVTGIEASACARKLCLRLEHSLLLTQLSRFNSSHHLWPVRGVWATSVYLFFVVCRMGIVSSSIVPGTHPKLTVTILTVTVT